MSIIVSSAYALSEAGRLDGWKPVIGWHNLVTAANLTATSEDADYPAINLATPRTNSLWKAAAATSPQYLTCLFGSEYEVGYAGLARHNLGSGGTPVTVQGLPAGGTASEDADWVELVAAYLPANDRPHMSRFANSSLIGVRLKLEPVGTAPQAAVLRIGQPTVLAKGLPTGHVPITYGEEPVVSSPRSQGGDHLGRTMLGNSLRSSIEQRDLEPDWYREHLEPFRAASKIDTFFWAPFPVDYPTEVGYCEVTNNPMPTAGTGGRIDIGFEIAGIAL